MEEITITGYTPGALGRIVELHGSYYAEHWDLGSYFEAKVAVDMGEFLGGFDAAHDGAWFAQVEGQIIGGIFISGSRAAEENGRLRWFIVDPAYQGRGLGRRLMEAAMAFCREKGFRRVYLTTFEGLTAARHLYEKHGFVLIGEEDATDLTGNSALTEQVFECILPGGPA
jgi:GNAT superfamily N-acetyltransferase